MNDAPDAAGDNAPPVIPWTVPARYATRTRAPLASRIGPVTGPSGTPPTKSRAVAILGLADDLGVRLNGGRPGAAGGPAAFRDALSRYGVAEPEGFEWPVVVDAGDIVPVPGETPDALFETHARVSAASGALVKLGYVPIGIGGGHDLTFPFVRGVIDARRELGLAVPETVVYVDPHLDVRAEPGSGMPFRSLVESCGVRRLANIGFSPVANTREHAAWFRTHGGTTHAPDEAAAVGSAVGVGALSFDIDSLDMAYAPGVSALNPMGLTPREAAGIIEDLVTRARTRPDARPWVACADFMELSPANDPSGRTARLVAHLFLALLARL